MDSTTNILLDRIARALENLVIDGRRARGEEPKPRRRFKEVRVKTYENDRLVNERVRVDPMIYIDEIQAEEKAAREKFDACCQIECGPEDFDSCECRDETVS